MSLSEGWLLERTAAVATDYLYQLDLPEDFSEEDGMSQIGDLQYRSVIGGQGLIRLW